MSLRDDVYSALTGSTAVTDDVPVESIYGSAAFDTVPQTEPFIVIRADDETPVRGISGVAFSDFQIYVHDRGQSRLRTDRILLAVRAAITGLASDGDVIQADWQGDSPDQPDDALNTTTRFASFRIARKVN